MFDCLRDWWEGLFYKEPEQAHIFAPTEEERAERDTQIEAAKDIVCKALTELGYNVLPDDDYTQVYVYKNPFRVHIEDWREGYPEQPYHIKTMLANTLYDMRIKGDIKVQDAYFQYNSVFVNMYEVIPFDKSTIPTDNQ